MKLIDITPLPSDADAADLAAVFSCSLAGQAFSLDLGDGRVALLTLACVRPAGVLADPPAYPPGRSAPWTASASAITKLLLSGQARSIHAACMTLAFAGKLRGSGTPENIAHYHARLYRENHCKKIKPETFRNLPTTQNATHATLVQSNPEANLPTDNTPALAPDRLHLKNPRRFLIDLKSEPDGDADYSAIIAPTFWAAGRDVLQWGDVVTLIQRNGEVLDIQILDPHPDGFNVVDLASVGRPHPDLPSEATR